MLWRPPTFPTYRVHGVVVNGRTRYRIGSRNALVGWSHPLYPAMRLLSGKEWVLRKHGVDEAVQHVMEIMKVVEWDDAEPTDAGVYVLCLLDQNGYEHAAYAGQSVHLSARLQQHKDALHAALTGQDTLQMYRELAQFVSLGDRMLVHSFPLSRGLVRRCYRFKPKNADRYWMRSEVLTILEQHAMDAFKPMLNAAAARPTRRNVLP